MLKNWLPEWLYWYLLFRSQSHEENKAKELLKVVRRGGKSAYDVFVEVLLQSETQISLGELLKKDSTMMDNQYGKLNGYSMKYDSNLNHCMLMFSVDSKVTGNH